MNGALGIGWRRTRYDAVQGGERGDTFGLLEKVELGR